MGIGFIGAAVRNVEFRRRAALCGAASFEKYSAAFILCLPLFPGTLPEVRRDTINLTLCDRFREL